MANYQLTELPVAVGVSGGRTSGYLAAHIWEEMGRTPNPEVIFSFQNTGEEVEPTYEFLHTMEVEWGLPLVWLEWWDVFNVEDYRTETGELSKKRLRGQEKAFRITSYESACRDGEPFDKMLEYYWMYRMTIKPDEPPFILPTLVSRMCTSNLKIKTAERYMASIGLKNFWRVAGIRYDEPRRWNRRNSDVSLHLLIDNKVTKAIVNEWWRQQSFNLKLDEDSIEGNCRHCFLKNPSKAVAIMKKVMSQNGGQPDEELNRWLERERKSGMTFRVDRPPYAQLVQIAKNEMATGVVTEFDEALYPDYKCDCAGTSHSDME